MSEPYNPFTSVAGRRNRHAIYFSEEGVRRGDTSLTYVAGGVGGDTVNGIGVVLRNRQRIASEDANAAGGIQHEQVFAAVQTSGQRLGPSG